jgi:peptidoglycan/xylan/chitin deacetylase (PgdA/CDA1 family)
MARRIAVWFVFLGVGVALGSVLHRAQHGTARQYWERAQHEVYKSPEELQAQHQRELRKGEHYLKLMRGDPNVRAVALTFDDGPHPAFTPQIIAILGKYNVKATFFVVGKMARQSPELVKREAAAGHVVGNHSYDHVNLTKIPVGQIGVEWRKCNALIKSVLGADPTFCRPPGGDYDKDVITAAADAGLTTVLWTDDPGDYAKPGDKVIEKRVLRRIDNGAIVLMHDGVQQTIDVLPQIIEHLQKRGFTFQTVAEMAQGHAEATLPPTPL